MIHRTHAGVALCVLAVLAVATSADAQMLGPSPYLSLADSPLLPAPFNYFFLEDLEDGAMNSPGVLSSSLIVLGPGPLEDSVDADDGLIDGLGQGGRSLYSGGSTSITLVFDGLALGGLPTHAGLVWTDVGFANPVNGIGDVIFEAFDAVNAPIGVVGPVLLGDGAFDGGTAEDRFFGVVYPAGIGSIRITMPGSDDFEVDHLQYGRVPEPATLAFCGAGLLIGGLFRRRRAHR